MLGVGKALKAHGFHKLACVLTSEHQPVCDPFSRKRVIFVGLCGGNVEYRACTEYVFFAIDRKHTCPR